MNLGHHFCCLIFAAQFIPTFSLNSRTENWVLSITINMKNILLICSFLFATIGISQAQVSKEEECMRAFFEAWKNNDKKALANLCLKESDYEAYTASQKALGSTKELSKADFEKFIAEQNKKIIREFDELRKSATDGKITFPDTQYASYKKIAAATAEVPAGYYKVYFNFHTTFKCKMQLECVPVGDGFRVYNLLESVTM
jgi:hypothetical protein